MLGLPKLLLSALGKKKKEKTETYTICLEDTSVSKIHTVEGCAHRFCFSYMKEHVKSKLLNGKLPAGCLQEDVAMNSATHVGKNGRRRKQPAPALCGKN
ncbi:hypothetical protein EJB05_53216, partial [Eragrostis curvula]